MYAKNMDLLVQQFWGEKKLPMVTKLEKGGGLGLSAGTFFAASLREVHFVEVQ